MSCGRTPETVRKPASPGALVGCHTPLRSRPTVQAYCPGSRYDGNFLTTSSGSSTVRSGFKSTLTFPVEAVGSQGLTEKPMLIPEVDFSGIARALGAESAIIRSLADLSTLQDWIDAGAKGTFVADCRITSIDRQPWRKMGQLPHARAAVWS